MVATHKEEARVARVGGPARMEAENGGGSGGFARERDSRYMGREKCWLFGDWRRRLGSEVVVGALAAVGSGTQEMAAAAAGRGCARKGTRKKQRRGKSTMEREIEGGKALRWRRWIHAKG